MAVADPLIELRDVNKHYGALHVLQGITLTVGRGEVVVAIGPSGSGKSTQLAREGMTMVVVTHEMGFARSAANRVVFMADGRIVEDRTPEEFFASPRSERAKDFLSKILKR
ncbi:hypothetical protein [Streptomyces sp. NPDC056524]|uniref:hypothetical protein n=1 Tax=Streptomyces sp. NPDC056524 TaxID=3345851 RepID=UPI00368BCD55